MNNDIQLFLLSVGGALAAGFVLGALVAALLRRAPRRPAPLSAPAGSEILAIDADPVGRKLLLRVAGAPVDGADAIADAEVREHVRALMRLLGPDAPAPAAPNAKTVLPASPPGPATAAPVATPNKWNAPPEPRAEAPAFPPPLDAGTPALPDPPDDLSAPFLTRLSASLRPQAPAGPVKPKPAPVVRAPKIAPAVEPPPADMFEQINVILQRKLAGQPQAPDIKLFGEEGELRLQVGNEVFRKVDDVSDARVRAWIREAVSEWEAG